MAGYEQIEPRKSHIYLTNPPSTGRQRSTYTFTVWAGVANDEYLPSDSNRQRVIRFNNIRNVLLLYSL